MTETNNDITQLQTQRDELLKKNNELKDKITKLNKENESLTTEINLTHKFYRDLNAEKEQTISTLEFDHKSIHSQFQNKINYLEAENKDKTTQNNELNNRVISLTKENQSLKDKIKTLEKDNSEMKHTIALLLEKDEQKDKDINWLKQKVNDMERGKSTYRKTLYDKYSTKSEDDKKFIVLTCTAAMYNYYLQFILLPLLKTKYKSTKKASYFKWEQFRTIFDTDNDFKNYALAEHGVKLDEVRRLKQECNDDGEDETSIQDILKAVEEFEGSLPSHTVTVEKIIAHVKADII